MSDTLTARRTATRERILEAAWEVAERDGLATWTVRDLAAAVGMRAPSLYTHFDGKDAIHDALFAEGWALLEARLGTVDDDLATRPPFEVLVEASEVFFDFCTESVARYQLLFTHVLGEWEPSPASYAVSQRTYGRMVVQLAGAGITDPAAVDLWTGLISGLVAQQLANDRGGDRWRRLVPEAAQMFLAHTAHTARTSDRSTP